MCMIAVEGMMKKLYVIIFLDIKGKGRLWKGNISSQAKNFSEIFVRNLTV